MDHLQILKRLKGIRFFTQRKFTLWDRYGLSRIQKGLDICMDNKNIHSYAAMLDKITEGEKRYNHSCFRASANY